MWGRFVCADVLLINNSYCYCSNNVLNRVDTNGTDDFSIQETSQEAIKIIISLFKSVYEGLLHQPAPYHLFDINTTNKVVYSKRTEYIKSTDEKIQDVNAFIGDSVDQISELAGMAVSTIAWLFAGMYIAPETVSEPINYTLSYLTTGLGYGFDYGFVRCNAGHNHTTYSLTVYDSAGINRHRATISITTCNAGIHGTQVDYDTITGWQVLWQAFIDSLR